MQKLFDNRMAVGWKISFILCVLWAMLILSEPYLHQGDVIAALIPFTIWFTARWIKVGKE